MEATAALQLLEDHRASLAKVKEMEHLDLVLMSMIESSNYTIAMALYLSAWMKENAAEDLSRAEEFEDAAAKYIRIASALVAKSLVPPKRSPSMFSYRLIMVVSNLCDLTV